MKKLLFIILVLFLTPSAWAVSYPGKIIFTNGEIVEGMVQYPTKGSERTISFRKDKKSKKVNYKGEEIRTLLFPLEKGGQIEIDYKMVITGLKFNTLTPVWLPVVKRGPATLYRLEITGRNSNGTFFVDISWYIFRSGEIGASKISWTGFIGGNNAYFKKYAPEYFSDYPELAKKIEEKEYKYDDLVKVVEEYNQWVENSKEKISKGS
jgi:hypothetical protein